VNSYLSLCPFTLAPIQTFALTLALSHRERGIVEMGEGNTYALALTT
jgi:hypothetical protein